MAYHVTRPLQIGVDIHDVRGRLVRTVSQAVEGPGTHVLDWDGLDASGCTAPAGFYMVRVYTGESTRTQKVVLLR